MPNTSNHDAILEFGDRIALLVSNCQYYESFSEEIVLSGNKIVFSSNGTGFLLSFGTEKRSMGIISPSGGIDHGNWVANKVIKKIRAFLDESVVRFQVGQWYTAKWDRFVVEGGVLTESGVTQRKGTKKTNQYPVYVGMIEMTQDKIKKIHFATEKNCTKYPFCSKVKEIDGIEVAEGIMNFHTIRSLDFCDQVF